MLSLSLGFVIVPLPGISSLKSYISTCISMLAVAISCASLCQGNTREHSQEWEKTEKKGTCDCVLFHLTDIKCPQRASHCWLFTSV